MQRAIESIILELAKKYDLPEEVAIAIAESQFKCAREEIGKATRGVVETFINVRFKNLGLIYADHNKIKAIEHARAKRSNPNNAEHGHGSDILSEKDDRTC